MTTPLRIAFQGERGAYSELALRRLVGEDSVAVPCQDFATVLDSLCSGTVDRGILPVENSLAGSTGLLANWDAIAKAGLHSIAEIVLRVRHCLLALPGTKLTEINEVRSHPQALAQCRQGLVRIVPGVRHQATWDTAGAARDLAASRETGVAVVASSLAASTWGLDILAHGIEDVSTNRTRFLLVAPPSTPEPAGPGRKCSVVFTLDAQGPGQLFRALGVFALRDLDLARIESRPAEGRDNWTYRFYLDIREGDRPGRLDRALEHLAELSSDLVVLGRYPEDTHFCCDEEQV